MAPKKVINDDKPKKSKKKDEKLSINKKEDLGDCTICCSKFNRSINSKSICPHCQVEICKKCIQTYLLGSLKDPHCMNCKNYWSQEILQNLTSKSFRTGEYKAHRQTILLDREKGYLQLAVPYVEETRKSRLYWKLEGYHLSASTFFNEMSYNFICFYDKMKSIIEKNKFILKDDDELEDEERRNLNLFKKYMPHLIKIYNMIGTSEDIHKIIDNSKDKISNLHKCYSKELKNEFPYMNYLEYKYKDYKFNSSFNKKDKEYKYQFKCQNGECRGFLNDEWICGVCSYLTCKHCLTAMGEIKNMEKPNEERSYLKKIHGCKPEDIETANLLKKDSKPCPKCHTLIYRIDGCLQMFCTFCKTAFDWKTGEIVTKGIHNPHFFQWKNGQMKDFGHQNGEEGEEYMECCEDNGFVNINTVDEKRFLFDCKFDFVKKYYKKETVTKKIMKVLFDYILGLRNHYHDLIDEYRIETVNNIHENKNLMKLRIDYLIGDISETEWKARILIEENKTLRISEIRQLIDLMVFATGESLLKLRTFLTTNDKYDEHMYLENYLLFLVENFNLYIYIEQQFEKLQKFYNVIMPYFAKDFMEFINKIDIPHDVISMKDEEKREWLKSIIVIGKDVWSIIGPSNYYYNQYESRLKKDFPKKLRKKNKSVIDIPDPVINEEDKTVNDEVGEKII